MHLPLTLIKNIETVYGDRGELWLQQLPLHLKELECQWNFRFIKPIADLTFNFVGLVSLNESNKMAIVKTAPAGEHLINEIHCLLCFKNAVPKIYKYDEEKYAFLMEYITPGYSLKTFIKDKNDSAATHIICQAILELQKNQQHGHFKFKHLSEFIKDLKSLEGKIDSKMLSKAESLFHELTKDRSQDVILHGDLHHDNIIRHESSWSVIDPHGYVGDPTAEVGVMIRNPMDCFPDCHSPKKIVDTRLHILREELPFDPQRIKAWAFCMTILSAAWNMQDFNHLAKTEIELAVLIDKAKI